ncbi:GDP-Man:Man(3)GlcNAc(2)-PP-Dol alpha-1,2-mannosyltransferase-like [Corticium candelabrum]|uniref:GDP-Man:Man(3)GlcNAc(2)-PP-Dol alpha-1,2-mannosyltransferase-like n=1 Tax=Corticium candelabrum TaxID=121492 RepID=UPI002E252920|nr:GDP-Man:Man(3)GlcNAc(2)-PP-Dol alpha-1,2-mannosyltransferase-like [Corticium candelabrum]
MWILNWLCCLLIVSCVFVFAPVLLLGVFARYAIRRKSARLLQELKSSESGEFSKRRLVVGFFHPYCNAGGGGERVLWCMLRALQTRYSFIKCVVFTGDTDAMESDILSRARKQFNVHLKDNVHFIYLKRRRWVEATMWPYLTLLGQSFGSLVLGLEALWSLAPDVYIDTMGYAFTMPLFKLLGGCRVGCYVHYPTVSTDMLSQVQRRQPGYNNNKMIAQSGILSYAKVLYYKMFAFLYMLAGKCSDVILVNSSWTHEHIVSLWKRSDETFVVYPPCDTKSFCENPLFDSPSVTGYFDIVSVAQFRPEKDHKKQLEAFHKFYKKLSGKMKKTVRLILVGSCRDKADTDRLDDLRQLADDLGIHPAVSFKENVSFDDLKQILCSATIGLHTMWNEHFGIGVVECMAAGAIILAHNSGGPKLDIVIKWQEKPTGFLAHDAQSYAEKMRRIYDMKPQERLEMKQRARASVEHRFSEETFEASVVRRTERLFAW